MKLDIRASLRERRNIRKDTKSGYLIIVTDAMRDNFLLITHNYKYFFSVLIKLAREPSSSTKS